MKPGLIGLAVFAATTGFASPALAADEALFDCPMEATTPALAQRISDIVEPGNGIDYIGEPRTAELIAIVRKCALDHDLPQAMLEPYALYYMARLTREETQRRLEKLGIPLPAIQRAFDIGEGRSNQARLQVTDAMADDLMTLLDAAGIDVSTMEQSTLVLIGAYGRALSSEWHLRAQFD